MDDITACAAVIELDEDGNILVSACDDKFCQLMGWPGGRISVFCWLLWIITVLAVPKSMAISCVKENNPISVID